MTQLDLLRGDLPGSPRMSYSFYIDFYLERGRSLSAYNRATSLSLSRCRDGVRHICRAEMVTQEGAKNELPTWSTGIVSRKSCAYAKSATDYFKIRNTTIASASVWKITLPSACVQSPITLYTTSRRTCITFPQRQSSLAFSNPIRITFAFSPQIWPTRTYSKLKFYT